MAEPKKKLSRTRTHRRRAQYTISSASPVLCSNCNEPTLAHRVCPHCGYYKGQATWKQTPTKRIVVDSNEAEPTKE